MEGSAGPIKFFRVEIHPEETAVIYTDGSRLANPNRGGIGIVVLWTDHDGHEQVYTASPPGYKGVTPPQMELKAAIEGVKLLLRNPPIVPRDLYRKVWIYSDATYLVNNHQAAKSSWPRQKWHTRDGSPVENVALWKELIRFEKKLGLRLEIHKVKGHGTNPHNDAADKLARTSATGAHLPPLIPSVLRRKKSPKRLIPGAVLMEGQRLTIHVHKGEFMRAQNMNQFEFSVETAGHFHNEVAIAYATPDLLIKEGHSYLVRFNEDPKYPQIEEMIMEVLEGGESQGNEGAD
jgi:ribonuclease HI